MDPDAGRRSFPCTRVSGSPVCRDRGVLSTVRLLSDHGVVLEGLPRRLGHLKANGLAGLPQSDIGPVLGVAVRCHSSDAEADEVAATQFPVHREVGQCQVPRALLQIQFGADRPDLTLPLGRSPSLRDLPACASATTPMKNLSANRSYWAYLV